MNRLTAVLFTLTMLEAARFGYSIAWDIYWVIQG